MFVYETNLIASASLKMRCHGASEKRLNEQV